MSSYCGFVDAKDWEGLKTILVKNINFTFQNESGIVLYTFNSRKSFLLACSQGIGEATTIHHLHDPEINPVNKNEADGVWAMTPAGVLCNSGKAITPALLMRICNDLSIR